MAKLTLVDLASLNNQTSAITTINNNNALIETALENTLSRDGTVPNSMGADFDMNTHRILNLPQPVDDTEPVRLEDIQPYLDAVNDAVAEALTAVDSFTDIYLGRIASNPTTDLDGDPLQEGTLYYNTVSHQLRVYSLGVWVAVAPFTDLATIAAYVIAAAASAAAASSSATMAGVSETNAAASASAANISANAAAGSATAADNSADAADISEANALASAVAADTSADAAAVSADAAAAYLDSFSDVYLGPHHPAPGFDNDGDALTAGDLYYDTGEELLKYFNGTTWTTLTTTAGLLEVSDDPTPSLGGDLDLAGFTINGTGTINITGTITTSGIAKFSTLDLGGATDSTLARASAGRLTIEGSNVVMASDFTGTGLVVQTAGNTFITRTLTGPAAGISVSNGSGVSGNPTLALVNDLSAVEGLSSNGLAARTATDTWTTRTITQPAAGITVSNGDGVSGNPTLALANDLAGLEGLASNGLATRTTTDTWTVRTLTGTSAEITVTNGDGVSGNPTFSIPSAVTFTGKTITGGTFASITLTGPALGTPVSGVLTNCTGLPTILVANEATDTTCFLGFFTAATGELGPKTNANLAFNSNTGVLTLVAPILGTPTSGTLTNCTGLPIAGLVSSTSTALGLGSIELGNASDTTLTRSAAGVLAVEGNNVLVTTGNAHKYAVAFVIDGGGTTITTGVKGDFRIPWASTITKQSVLLDQSGSIVLDIWKDTYANYPPTVADTITASAKPTISSTTKTEDSTLTGWTTSVTAGDTVRVNVDSVTTATRATLTLEFTKTQ